MALKLKNSIQNILNNLMRFSGYLDSILFFVLYIRIKDSEKTLSGVFFILSLLILVYNLYLEYQIFISKQTIKYDGNNSRVQAYQGGQGRGKTSLMLYVAGVLSKYRKKSRVYSNVPFKLFGDYTYLFSTEIINLIKKVPEGSVLIFDEITLYFHNLVANSALPKKEKEKILKSSESFEYLLQLCRHFFDGNILFASVNMGRIPKQLEEKIGLFKDLQGQTTKYNSLFFAFVFSLIGKMFKLKICKGVRKWTYLKLTNLDKNNYYVDIADVNKKAKNDEFSGYYATFAYNCKLNYEYNDRFMKYLYDNIQTLSNEKYNNLEFDFATLKKTGFDKIIEYFEQLFNNLVKQNLDFDLNFTIKDNENDMKNEEIEKNDT